MEPMNKIILQAFDEIDGCLEYCRSARENAQDAETYVRIASSKLDNASSLLSVAERYATERGEDGQPYKDAFRILSEVVNERIRSARNALSSI